MTEDWEKWLTDGERLALNVYRRGPHRAGEADLESFAHTIVASREETRQWQESSTIQAEELEAVLAQLEKAECPGPASPGVERLRLERDASRAQVAEKDKVTRMIGVAHQM